MQEKQNPLKTERISVLLRRFAVPSIIAMLVGALYNIVDQFFIGQSIGELGNAATNVAFPLSTMCIAISLLFGIGGASAFNLTMGRGDPKRAIHFIGNAAAMLVLCGTVLCIVVRLFLTPMLCAFGAPDNVLPLARTYTGITSLGFPFLILSTGGGHLIRADGSPRFSMTCNLTGAIINTILDPLFIFGFGWGMAGAALATIIGQFVAAILVIRYLMHYKTVPLQRRHLRPRWEYIRWIMSLGAASCFNQIAITVVQIVMNNSLTYYGALSIYGESIPLACAGIITKVNQIFLSVIIGLAQAIQPLASFNYGAKQYGRVRQTYRLAVSVGFSIALLSFVVFQGIPRQIISLFGSGDELYFQFAVSYFRIFLLCTFLNFLQPITSTFFTAIGKPKKGMFLSMTRQILFLLPLIVILPLWFGIDGILYSGPIADFIAALVSFLMIRFEMRHMPADGCPAS
ncbi:MAG: MATE family efflux transporter [Eubacteriales bacterium]|nr:MATE family efflux transporter [Eubacteriales bacterium]